MLDVKAICSAVLFCSALVGHSFELTKCTEEADCIDKIKPLVARNDRELTITAKEGANNVIRFVNQIPSANEEAKVVKHELAAYNVERRIFLIVNYYYEDYDFTLVRADNGEKLDLDDIPDFSPSGERFVCVTKSGGGWDRTRDHDFIIWSIDKDTFRQEFLYKNPPEEHDFEWAFVAWDGENRIKLKATYYDKSAGIDRDNEAEAILTPEGWKVNVLGKR